MVRTPALSANMFLDIMNARENRGEIDEDLDTQLAAISLDCYTSLRKLMSDPQIKQALWVASTDIFEGITRIQQGMASLRRLEHTYSGILRYMTRMCTRPTPFGLFSGVGMGYLGTKTTMQLGPSAIQHIRTRPDIEWLLALIQKIEEDKNLVPLLCVKANSMAYIVDQRAMLPQADVYGKEDKRSITIRATSVVKFILEQTRQSIPYSMLRNKLFEKFPNATTQQVDGILQQLWENHFLMSNLRPPLTGAQPERYVLEQLQHVPGTELIVSTFKQILEDAAEIDRVGVGGSTRLISTLMERQQQLVPKSDYTKQLYQIDSKLELDRPQLNKIIGEAVAGATETLLRLGHFPYGSHSLYEYRSAFVERYGMDVEVPLLDVLSPEVGLDAPPTYTEPPRSYPLPQLPVQNSELARDTNTALCSLLAQALHMGAMEIELTEPILQTLTQWTPQDEKLPPAALEMYLQIQATSPDVLDGDEWRGVVAPACLAYGGRTFGRFFDILGPEGLEKLQQYVQWQEALFPNVIFAELSYLPISGRATNMTIRPALRTYEITVNTTPSVTQDNVISLDDLVVGVQGNRFYVRSQRLGKEVIVTQSHMLNTLRAPNVCRFLLEVSQNSHPGLSSFDWGVAGKAPFLPRVVQKQIVLSSAQWNLQIHMITPAGSGSEEARWFRGLQQWREQWHVPRYIYLKEADNRLLLDLDHPLSIAELQHELKQAKEGAVVQLEEMLPDFAHLWLRDENNAPYLAEFVVPLILNKHFTAQSEQRESTKKLTNKGIYPHRVVTDNERRKLPGDEWTYLKLYAASKQHDEIIAKELPLMVHALHQQQLIDRWFYIRYNDPEPHLRVRFYTSNCQATDALLTQAVGFSRQLVQRGVIRRMCVDSYDREVERYGGPEAIDEMEKIFTTNSNALSSLVTALYQKQITLDPLAVAVLSLDQFFQFWGLVPQERLHYIQSQSEKYAESEAFRPQRKLFTELLAPWDTNSELVLREQREKICSILSIQEQVVKEVSAHMHKLAIDGMLWQSEESILTSLAHMHLNRLLGIDQERERKIYAFWRHTLESLQRRPARKEMQT